MMTETQIAERQTFTVDEVAKILGISRGTAFSRIHTGEIPSLRLGNRILISRRAIQRMLDPVPESELALET